MFRSSRSTDHPARRRAGAVVVALLASFALLGSSAVAVAAAPRALAPQASGKIRYFFVPSLHSRPFMITPGPDGNLWFTDSDASMIGRITPKGKVTEFDIGAGKKPYDIVAGPDGNLWFTENLNDKIGVVNTKGKLIHEYYAPGIDSRPAGITVGPDGNIWFVEMGSGEDITDDVGRVTMDGTVTVYNLQQCACFPIGITTGPDGKLWAAEELGIFDGNSPGTVDSITADDQTIHRYPVIKNADPGHLPAFVSPGPDGNVWFTEYASDLHRIGRITPKGKIKEFTIGTDPTNSVRIVTGPDGNLWVTQADANDVALVSPSGALLHTYPTHHEPAGITVGPDGNIWFTLALDGEIGRIKIPHQGHVSVLDIASGFVPASRAVPLGSTVDWLFQAPGSHGVRDATGLSLFDSGPKAPASRQAFAFTAAGTFAYRDPGAGASGSIAVPVAAPTSGRANAGLRVAWSTAAPRPGLVFDVQVSGPGSGGWRPWRSGVTATAGTFVPNGQGMYRFRARIRDAATSAASGWSPVKEVAVS